jgi:hypothetical protein
MKTKLYALPLLTIFTTVIGNTRRAEASLTLIGSGNALGPNMVVNGSFETGSPGPGLANQTYWATGTPGTPFLNIPGWTGSGQANNYALWGSDETTGPFHLRNSAILPDGQVGVYFGNGEQVSVSPTPIFNLDYTVSFNSPPVFSGPQYSGPVVLSQTIPTHLNLAPSYQMSFWVSGEAADTSPATVPGIFGLRLSNTDVANPTIYLQVPPGVNATIGQSHVYLFEFTPLNASQPVTIEFLNFGHAGFMFPSTEIVLDDVRVKVMEVPEPTSCALLGLGVLTLAWSRKNRNQ